VALRIRRSPHTAIELAQAEVAVGDERTHAARLGEGQSLAIVELAAFGVESVGMSRDSFTSTGTTDIFDANGVLLTTLCSRGTAVRIK
jgi:hypothetical protein